MEKIRKAVTAGIVAAAGALGAALTEGQGLSAATVGAALAVGVVAAYAVWRVPNAPA